MNLVQVAHGLQFEKTAQKEKQIPGNRRLCFIQSRLGFSSNVLSNNKWKGARSQGFYFYYIFLSILEKQNRNNSCLDCVAQWLSSDPGTKN